MIWKNYLLSTLYAINNVVGLPNETLNSMHQVAEAIHSDANFVDIIMDATSWKSCIIYVNTQVDTIISNFLNYDTLYVSNIKSLTKSDRVDTYLNYDVDVFLTILQAGIDRRVSINTVDINGNFNIHATSNDTLKIQKVDGSNLYDSLELSFNNVHTTSSVKVNNIDSLSSLNLRFGFRCVLWNWYRYLINF